MIRIEDAINESWMEEYEYFVRNQGFEWDQKNSRAYHLSKRNFDFFISFAKMEIEAHCFTNMKNRTSSSIKNTFFVTFKPTNFFEEYNNLIDWIVDAQNRQN